jgi:hypothetical protein
MFYKKNKKVHFKHPVFLLFFVFMLPLIAVAQSINPDAVVVKFMTGDGVHHTRTMNQIIADIKSNDEKKSYHSLMQLNNLNKTQLQYALSKLPAVVDLATGEVNWIIIRALKKMNPVGRDRLSEEVLSILIHGNEGNVFLAVQKTRLIHGHRSQVIGELSRIFMDQDYSKNTRQYAASNLFKEDARAHERIIKDIQTLFQSKDKQTRLFAFGKIRTRYNFPNERENHRIVKNRTE